MKNVWEVADTGIDFDYTRGCLTNGDSFFVVDSDKRIFDFSVSTGELRSQKALPVPAFSNPVLSWQLKVPSVVSGSNIVFLISVQFEENAYAYYLMRFNPQANEVAAKNLNISSSYNINSLQLYGDRFYLSSYQQRESILGWADWPQ